MALFSPLPPAFNVGKIAEAYDASTLFDAGEGRGEKAKYRIEYQNSIIFGQDCLRILQYLDLE